MKKQLLIVALALFLGTFTQSQSLFAYYPCELSHPGETGNCEGCGDLSPAVCHRDCTPTWSGYSCSQPLNLLPICSLNQEYSFGVTPYIKQCICPSSSIMVDSGRQTVGVHRFSCVLNNPNTYPTPNPIPQPEPVTYCELNKPYSFLIFPKETACTCPTNSNLVRPSWPTGTNSFTCVPMNVPAPAQYCEMNKSYFYNFSQTPCTCPIDSYKVVQISYGYTGGQSFTCVSNYQPHPSPAPIIMQTCWNSAVIPATSACLSKPVCSYNQYWSGYSCVDYYQPYVPVIQPVNQYPSVYDWQYYDQQDYNYNWSDTNSWSNVDWVYFN